MAMLDTGKLDWHDTKLSGSFHNRKECRLAVRLISALLEYGLPSSDIGVVSPYNSQIRLIKNALKNNKIAVDVSTVDKFQGRDKQCIIVSFVRSNTEAYEINLP